MAAAVALRDYQRDAVLQCVSLLPRTRTVLVAPTGSGKTVMGSEVVSRLGVPALFVVHRREIVIQAATALERCGLRTGLILSGHDATPRAPIQVASLQTLARRAMPHARLLWIDECHHATASSFRRLLDHYQDAMWLGTSATPFRTDGTGLGDVGFERIVVAATTQRLCEEGYLSEPTVYAPEAPDLKGVRRVAGDYHQGQLGRAMSQPHLVGNVVDTWLRLAKGKRTVVFAATVEHSETLCARFRAAGVQAEHLDGTTPLEQRSAILARLRRGVTTVLCNVGVLTEGWDLPALEVAVIARPTESLCLHLQCLGRVMRSAEGKAGAIVLDHAGNTGRHGLVTDPIAYTLSGRVRREGQATTKTCPGCALVVPAGVSPCPECGYVWAGSPREAPEEVEGELKRVNKHEEDAPEDRAAFYARMRRVAQYRGQDPDRVAAAAFRSRYGYWPLVLHGRLHEWSDLTETGQAQMRAQWAEVARRKGWDRAKTAWWVRRCEMEARQRARVGAAQEASRA